MKTGFLFEKADIAPLAIFRILMGLLMAAEGFGAIITGWVKSNYVDPEFAFHFIGFDFLQILVGPQAYAVYVLLGLFGIGIALGFRYYLSVLGYSLLWAAVYFGQKTSYNNHYYLLLIMCLLLLIVPAAHYRSLDVKQNRKKQSQTVPYWCIWIFKVLLLIVYIYAAIAKLYPDWLRGEPVRMFLSSKSDWPFIGPLTDNTFFIYLISYGGILFDLLIIPALWYKPTRKYAFAVAIFFHLFNSIVFHIGIFPYMMLITSVLFFEPEKIRWIFFRNKINLNQEPTFSWYNRNIVKPALISFLALMVLLPLRPFYFPGCVHWTEEGHRLSWHMMLRSKRGIVYFEVEDSATGERISIYPEEKMSPKMARKMATRPDMIWQYAQRIKKQYADEGKDVKVYAVAQVSLNGRNLQPLIDPQADLGAVDWEHLSANTWILPHPDL